MKKLVVLILLIPIFSYGDKSKNDDECFFDVALLIKIANTNQMKE